jgi:hypothetical protein
MSDKDLGKALLQLDAAQLAGVPDVRAQVAQVLARDRRRVKAWTLVTVLIWLLAMGLVLGILVFFGLLFPLHAKLKRPDPQGRITEAQRAELLDEVSQAFMMGSVLITLSVGALAAAALATVFLLFASRQATLRQMTAHLLEISEQMKQLRQLLADRPPGAPPAGAT